MGTPLSNTLFSWLPTINVDGGMVTGLDCVVNAMLGWLVELFGRVEPLAWFRGLAQFYNGLSTEPVNQFYFYRFMLGFFEGASSPP